MHWSQLSNQQRAWLSARAKWRPVIVRGQLVKHEPANAYAQAIVIAKALDRDRDRARQAAHKAANQALIAAYDGPVRKYPKVSYAYGAKERPKSRALPMQYFRRGGSA